MTAVPPRLASRPAPRGVALLLVLAFGLAALPALPDLPLRRASQARAWVVARNMASSGDWLLPRYAGEPRLKKPPLQSWAQAGAMVLVGRDALWVAGLASWVVGILFALGPWMVGWALGRPLAGCMGSLLLASTRATVWWGVSPEHDMPFAGWVALSLAFLARAQGPGARRRDAVLSGLACGAAVLVKGPFALAFVLGTALVAGWRRPTAEGAPSRSWTWGCLLVGSVLPASLWLAAVLARLGSLSAVFDELGRQALGGAGAHTKPFPASLGYYLAMIPKWSMPWAPVGLAALAILLARRRRGLPTPSGPSLRFAWVALGVTFVVLTATPAKQEHYLLPALPPAFLLLGAWVEDVAAVSTRARRATVVVLALVAVGFTASRALPARAYGYSSPVGLDLGVLGGLLVLALLAARSPTGRGTLVPTLLVACVATGFASRRDAVRFRATDDYEAAVAAAPSMAPNRPVLGYAAGEREAFDTVAAWLRRDVVRLRDVGAVKERVARGEPFYLLVEEPEARDLEDLRADLRWRTTLSPSRPESPKDRIRVLEHAPGPGR